MADSKRRDEIRAVHRKYRLFYQLLGGGVILVVGILIGALFFADKDSYAMNVVTEGFGVVAGVLVTVLVVDRLNERRDEQRQTEELKTRLVREAGSRSNHVAIAAIEQLRHHGWLMGDDGLLKGQTLAEADLSGANLRSANLSDAGFWRANLQGADLWWTELTGAHLVEANLSKASMFGAKVEVADLRAADLRGANMNGANFELADLRYADMRGADLEGAKFDGARLLSAIYPDGNTYFGTYDLYSFTHPKDPESKNKLNAVNEIRREMGLPKLPREWP